MAQRQKTLQHRLGQEGSTCYPLQLAKMYSTAVDCTMATGKYCSSGTSFTDWPRLLKHSALPKVNRPTYQILTKIN
jgi:hypothetical protein